VRWALAIVVVACSSSDAERESRELAALDLAQASERVRGMIADCAGFTRALERMSRLTGRALAGLVDDAVEVARTKCPAPLNAARGRLAAQQLARARLLERPADALAVLDAGSQEPAIRLRRAELLDAQQQAAAALAEIDGLPDVDDEMRGFRRSLVIAVVATGKPAEVTKAIAEAPITERPGLANRAVAHAPLEKLAAFIPTATVELATAIADRLEREQGPVPALAARTRAATLAPDDADVQDALARALASAQRMTDALAAWDRAAALAPAQPSYRLAPVRALVLAGHVDEARDRARKLATAARASRDPEALTTASNAASDVDLALAITLAREAYALKPTDGRFAFQLGQKLADAGEVAAAAAAYTELLVCGKHGRPWHRHEVAGKILELATDRASSRLVIAALDAKRECATVEPADLATYFGPTRAKLGATR
jgi:tetratricopeptide (TPR) repeat protein